MSSTSIDEKLAEFVRAAPENASQSFAVAFKRLSQPFDFKTGAKQREQTSHKDHAAPGRQEHVGVSVHLWKMPENDNGE
jgi:hypothetical protein